MVFLSDLLPFLFFGYLFVCYFNDLTRVVASSIECMGESISKASWSQALKIFLIL
jgi:hypothetical protein